VSAVARAEKSIVVRVPVRAAYRWWTAYEDFPEFLDGVTRVTRRDDAILHLDVEIAGQPQQWEARVDTEPEHRVAWHTTGAPHAEGEVELKPVEGGQTLVTLRMVYEPVGAHDVEGAHGMVDRLVMNSLERFKAYAEPREERRLPRDDAPPPAGAETVTGPEGERGGPDDADAGELPFAEQHHHGHAMQPTPDGFERLLRRVEDAEPARPIGADELGVVHDPDAAHLREPDVNEDDNAADWSRTR
jgi:hypothetical protein